MHPGVVVLSLLVGGLVLVSFLRRGRGGFAPLVVVAGLAGVTLILIRFPYLIAPVALGIGVLAARMVRGRQGGWVRSGGANGASPGTSEVVTDFVEMAIDHETGVMSGQIRAGTFAGQSIRSLSISQLCSLLQECRSSDPDGARVVEAYLDREHPGWREGDDAASDHESGDAARSSPASGEMTLDEAAAVLGLPTAATETEVVEAHRRLMQRLHPDRGGSSYLASQINKAKDTLLGR